MIENVDLCKYCIAENTPVTQFSEGCAGRFCDDAYDTYVYETKDESNNTKEAENESNNTDGR